MSGINEFEMCHIAVVQCRIGGESSQMREKHTELTINYFHPLNAYFQLDSHLNKNVFFC